MSTALVVIAVLVLVVLPIASVISAALTPGTRWAAADQNKLAWVLVTLFVPFGWVAYLTVVRPRLRRAGDGSVGATTSGSVPANKARSGPRRPWGTYVLYVVTALGLVYLFVPLFTIARFTFNQPASNYNTEWNEFTLDNWKHAFDASDYRDAFVESLKVATVACTLATILGALVSLAITRYKMKGGAAINLLLVLPLTTPEIVLGASTFTLFFNQGVQFGFWTIVIAHTTFCLSFVALTVKARIRGLDWSLEDAAADLGSPPLRTFVKITLPLVIPGIVGAFLLSLSLSIDDYIITSFVAGNVSTFPREIWDSYIREVVPQVQVFTTMIMLVVIVLLVATTAYGRRKAKQAA